MILLLLLFSYGLTDGYKDFNRIFEVGIKSKNYLKYEEEFEKIKKSAEAGDPYLQNRIGWMYDQGLGMKENPKKAIEWYLKSANQGFKKAQINLGVMLETGRGTPIDLEEANKWYLKAEMTSEDAK